MKHEIISIPIFTYKRSQCAGGGRASWICWQTRDPDFVQSLATLDLIDTYLSDEFDSIENNPKSSNILVRTIRAIWQYQLTFGEDASIKIGEIAMLVFSLVTGIFSDLVAS